MILLNRKLLLKSGKHSKLTLPTALCLSAEIQSLPFDAWIDAGILAQYRRAKILRGR